MDKTYTIDRVHGPTINPIGDLSIPRWESTLLNNGVKLIEVSMGSQELVSLEIIHFASRSQEDKLGVSRAVARLIREGTSEITSREIAEKIDFHGASMSTGANLDFSFIKLFTLNKYFEDLLPIVEGVRYDPVFPQDELERYVKNNIQKLVLDRSKVELQSYKLITEKIFGEKHIYGYNSDEELYKSITTQDIRNHYDKYYGSDNCIIVLSGKITPAIRKATIRAFGSIKQEVELKKYCEPVTSLRNKRYNFKVDEKSQSSIKLGTRLWSRKHQDFSGMFVLNTILGGYFGSRLMSKIREEKGYTYSIYSGLDMLKNDGYFFISTEVGNEHIEDTIITVYEEIEKLQNELVKDSELYMVKNYLRGNFLNMVDGPFKIASLAKLTEINELPRGFFTDLSKYVKNVSAEEIMNYAQRYLVKENMLEVVAG